jgi:hypothetical protein
MKRLLTVMAVSASLAAIALVAPTSAEAAPFCGIRWGSLTKTGSPASTVPLVNVRGGRHTCYDRLVMDFAGKASGFSVRYVSAVHDQGRGEVVPLRGGAFVEIVLQHPAYDVNTGAATYQPSNPSELVNVNGWRTFRQVAYGGSFEGYTTIGLGVRARLPFRVFVVSGPGSSSRLVVDVAHQW